MTNIHSNPKEFGLTLIYEVDCGEAYEFDILALWRRESDGAILIGTDSGCSCPSPFEDQSVKDLEIATPEAINEWFDTPDYGPRRNRLDPADRQEALAAFSKELKVENAANLDEEIRTHEELLTKLKARKVALDSQTPEMLVASKLHTLLCFQNHADGCFWHYEMNDKIDNWSAPTHGVYLAKAQRVISAVGDKSANDFLDALMK